MVAPGSNPQGFRIETYGYLFAVADGLGGHAAGEVASQMACEGLLNFYRRPLPEESSAILAELQALLQGINHTIFRKSLSANEFFGMGTTLSALLLRGQTAFIAHVGDSRIYRLRADTLERLTHDHTEAQALVDRGELTAEAARFHPARHYLTEAIGPNAVLQQLLARVERVQPGDTFLLTTDGITEVLADSDLRQVLLASSSCKEACQALLRTALERRSTDNLSVIVVHVSVAEQHTKG